MYINIHIHIRAGGSTGPSVKVKDMQRPPRGDTSTRGDPRGDNSTRGDPRASPSRGDPRGDYSTRGDPRVGGLTKGESESTRFIHIFAFIFYCCLFLCINIFIHT
jgi:hypothetical protein